MSTSNAIPANRIDLSNLDELETLIKEYSLYSRSAFGLGHLPGWATLVLALSLNTAGIHRWGICIAAAAPWVWLASREAIRSRLYQREGRVTELEMDRVVRNLMLGVLTVLCLVFAVQIRSLDLPDVVAPMSGLAFVAVAVFRVRSLREANNWLNMVSCLLLYGTDFAERSQDLAERVPHTLVYGVLLLLVIVQLGMFVREHIQYRRLERRLASLRGAL